MMMGMHRNALIMIYDKCIGNDKCYIHALLMIKIYSSPCCPRGSLTP